MKMMRMMWVGLVLIGLMPVAAPASDVGLHTVRLGGSSNLVKLKVRPLKLDLTLGGQAGRLTRSHKALIQNADEWRAQMLGCGYDVPGVKFKQAPVPKMPVGIDFSKEVLVFTCDVKAGLGESLAISGARAVEATLEMTLVKKSTLPPMVGRQPRRPGMPVPYALVAVQRPTFPVSFAEPIPFKTFIKGLSTLGATPDDRFLLLTDNQALATFVGRFSKEDYILPDLKNKSMIVAAKGHSVKESHGLKIDRIERRRGKYIVHLIESIAGPKGPNNNQGAAPYHMALVDIPNFKATFVVHKSWRAKWDVRKLASRPLALTLDQGKHPGFIMGGPHEAVIRSADEWRVKMLGSGYAVPGVAFEKAPVPPIPKVDFAKEMIVFLSEPKPSRGNAIAMGAPVYTHGKIDQDYTFQTLRRPERILKVGGKVYRNIPFAIAAIERPQLDFKFVAPPVPARVAFKILFQAHHSKQPPGALLRQVITDKEAFAKAFKAHSGKEAPAVDFAKKSVVLIAMPRGGKSVDLLTVQKLDEKVTIVITENLNAPKDLGWPVLIAEVDLPNMKARFHTIGSGPPRMPMPGRPPRLGRPPMPRLPVPPAGGGTRPDVKVPEANGGLVPEGRPAVRITPVDAPRLSITPPIVLEAPGPAPVEAPEPIAPASLSLRVWPLPGFIVTKPLQAIIRNPGEWHGQLSQVGYRPFGKKPAANAPPAPARPAVPPLRRGFDFSRQVIVFVSVPAEPLLASITIDSVLYKDGKMTVAITKRFGKRLRPNPNPGAPAPAPLPMVIAAVDRPPIELDVVEAVKVPFKKFDQGFVEIAAPPAKRELSIITDKKAFDALLARLKLNPGKFVPPDFTKQSVVVAIMEKQTLPGSAIRIGRISQVQGKLYIHVNLMYNDAVVPGQPPVNQTPYDILLIDKPNLKADFILHNHSG